MLGSLFIGQTVETIAHALDAARIDAAATGQFPLVVLGQPRVGRALRELGYRVVIAAQKRKALRRVSGERMCCDFDALPVADGSLAGIVAFDIGQSDSWQQQLSGWARAVRTDGALVLVDRASPAELTRRALCGGLLDIQQRQTGRTFVTSGLVARF